MGGQGEAQKVQDLVREDEDTSLDGAVNNGAFGAVDAVLMDVEVGVDDVACSHQ